jgi:CHAT domain-containing protein
MNFKRQILRFVIIGLIFLTVVNNAYSACSIGTLSSVFRESSLIINPEDQAGQNPSELLSLNNKLQGFLQAGDFIGSGKIVKEILELTGRQDFNDPSLTDAQYLLGIYFLQTKQLIESEKYLMLCILGKERNKVTDARYARALYNISIVFDMLGDLNKFEKFANKSLVAGKAAYGESSKELIYPYISLSVAAIQLNDYETAITYANNAMVIAANDAEHDYNAELANTNANLAVCFARLGNYTKAKMYFEKAISLYEAANMAKDDNYINTLDGLAYACKNLNLTNETEAIYTKGVSLAVKSNSLSAFTIIKSYCLYLAANDEKEKGERIMADALHRAYLIKDRNPRDYYEVLANYANYLREFKIDLKKSLGSYEKCLSYLLLNKQDLNLNYIVNLGYSRSLKDIGDFEKALVYAQSLLFPAESYTFTSNNYANPSIDSLKSDLPLLSAVRFKYQLLLDIYKKKGDIKTLEAASNTSELIISMIDKLRINISEDESRIILGDKYRDSYLNAIHDFNLLYAKTSDKQYLEKAFEYSEKSKIAGLLASTRELKATQFHIPQNLARFEMQLQKEISLLNISISDESASLKPNENKISEWKEGLLESTRKRDSLIRVFEKQYPEYYALKFNTKMISLNDLPSIIGNKGNYINYIFADSILYTFVVNRKNQQLISTRIDSSFFSDLKKFRMLLSMPSPTDNATLNYKEFQTTGYHLYQKLILPIKSLLISDKLFVSLDNILSYIPLETIPTEDAAQTSLNYRDLKYLMNSYDISYTYSATFMSDNRNTSPISTNSLIAFAPNYPDPLDIQKILMSRQAEDGILNDLPFARLEAEYVSNLTGGQLYENSFAKESVFKKKSGAYDIIHLSMHTLLNDKDPMHSTLIFSNAKDSADDGYLKTYEIYGIPLKAKMVVLSSCNTGTGILSSGEGILSLARGFIYSGSRSVVMSLWEIEDKSGTDVVEKFYTNLKEGRSKSESLKKARLDFLRNADQLRSHPYFWGTLVVYGNNEPLYRSNTKRRVGGAALLLIILAPAVVYLKRKYS